MKPFSKTEAFKFAWNAFKKEPWFLMGATIVVFAASALGGALSGSSGVFGIVLMVASILLQWWLYLGFARIALALYAGQPVTWNMLIGESWETLYHFALAALLAALLCTSRCTSYRCRVCTLGYSGIHCADHAYVLHLHGA